MTSKYEGHTPGPWKFDEGNHGSVFRPAFGLLDSWDGSLGVHVCDSGSLGVRPEREVIANARLVADAPTLLKQRDALREAVERIAQCSPPDDWEPYDRWGEPVGYGKLGDRDYVEHPKGPGDEHDHGVAVGRWEAAKIARKALALCDETEADPASIQQQKGAE